MSPDEYNWYTTVIREWAKETSQSTALFIKRIENVKEDDKQRALNAFFMAGSDNPSPLEIKKMAISRRGVILLSIITLKISSEEAEAMVTDENCQDIYIKLVACNDPPSTETIMEANKKLREMLNNGDHKFERSTRTEC